jgi:hypothetical protein
MLAFSPIKVARVMGRKRENASFLFKKTTTEKTKQKQKQITKQKNKKTKKQKTT